MLIFLKAVDDAIEASFGNSGQVCSSSSRLFLHEDISEKFLKEFENKALKLTVGPPEENPNLGPLVSKEQYDKVMNYINQGIKRWFKIKIWRY